MKMHGAGITDLGLKRSNNEDSFWVNDERGIFIVCDGMGGRAGGEVASEMAVTEVSKALSETEEVWKECLFSMDQDAFHRFINKIINTTCQSIYNRAKSDPQISGMGTTITGLLLNGDKAALFHVGDSRLYLCRGHNGYQLTNDHTLLQAFLSNGLIAPEEAKGHPHGHVLTRSLGTSASVMADSLLFNILPGDVLILCSDGLSGSLKDSDELAHYTVHESEEALPTALIQHANAEGGADNITAVIVRTDYSEDALEDRTEEVPGHPWGLFHQMMFSLQESFLCKGFELREVLRLLNICERVEFPHPGHTIVQEEEPMDCFYLILEGRCSISQEGRFARELNAGQTFGMGALIDEQLGLESVRTLSPSTLLQIKRSDFASFTQGRAKLGFKLMQNISKELNRSWRLLKEVVAEASQPEKMHVGQSSETLEMVAGPVLDVLLEKNEEQTKSKPNETLQMSVGEVMDAIAEGNVEEVKTKSSETLEMSVDEVMDAIAEGNEK